jgi:protein TonB
MNAPAAAASANAWRLYASADRGGARRWALSATAILAVHAALIAGALPWYADAPPPGATTPMVMIDMAPAPAAPAPSQQDVAPGPNMQQADAPSPPPEPPTQAAIEEQVPATPPQPDPTVQATPEQKAEPKPEPPKAQPLKTERHKPPPQKTKPVHARTPSERPPAPRTSAAPRAERRAALAAAARAGAAAKAALPAYRDLLAAHLQRFKEYPAAAREAGEQGTALLTFTVGRSGRVLASHLARSSGHAALDAETMAMIRRAQPLPAFPPEIKQASMSFTIPVRFAIR